MLLWKQCKDSTLYSLKDQKNKQTKICQPKIPYPEKITFKDKDVSDKQNDPHTNTTRYAKEIS